MSRSGRNYGKKPPDIGLQMDCYDEALTPEQVAAYNKGEKEYKEVVTKLEQMMKNLGGEIIEKSDSVYVMQMNNSSPPPVPALSANTPSTGKAVTSPATRQSAALIAQPTPATSAMVQAIQTPTGPVILQGSPQAQGVMTRASAGNALHSAGTYQLVMDPRLGLIVGAVTSPQATQGTPVIQNTTSLAKTPTVAPTTQTRSAVHTRTTSMRMQPNTVPNNQKVPASKPPSPAPSPATPTPTVPSLRIKPPKPPANQKAVSTKTPSPVASRGANSAARPTESNSVGGLSTGPGSKPWKSTTTSPVSAPVVDLTDDDGKPSSPTLADSREVTFNKLSGKTFPSLVVVARPHLRIKDMAQGTVSQERAALGRRGARGKRGHKEAIMSRNMLKLTEENHSSQTKANAGRKKRKRKRSVIETEEPRPLRLRLEQVKEPQNSAIKKADRQSSHSVNKREVKHPRYVVELVGHQTVRFEKEAGWQERRRTREKEALKATKRKLQKHISESDGQTERLEMEEGRQQKDVKFSAEQQAVYSKKKTKRGKQRSK